MCRQILKRTTIEDLVKVNYKKKDPVQSISKRKSKITTTLWTKQTRPQSDNPPEYATVFH